MSRKVYSLLRLQRTHASIWHPKQRYEIPYQPKHEHAAPRTTHQQIPVKREIATLALPAPMPDPPRVMLAVMIHPQPLRLPPHLPIKHARCRPRRIRRLPPLHPLRSRIPQPPLLPLRTLARLPVRRTQVAELPAAAARHVVAPVRELDEVAAPRAAPPARLRRELQDRAVRRGVARARRVRGLLALPARLRGARGAAVRVRGGRGGAEEARARWEVAVHAVRGAEFEGLGLEGTREALAEVSADVGQGEGLLAAARRVERLVDGGGAEERHEACLVVVVAAWRTDLVPADGVAADDALFGSARM